MMGQQPDPCKEPNRWYRITVVEKGKLLQLAVDGKLIGGFVDCEEIPESIAKAGTIGFRTIGSNMLLQIQNFKVTAIY